VTDSSYPRPRRLARRTLAGTLAVACVVAGAATANAIGIDVSRWQHGSQINWAKVKADGVTFAFIKATEGSFYTNSYYASDRRATKRVGIYRGAYHFARPSKGSAARQARYFVSKAGKHQGVGDLPPVLDLESSGRLGVRGLRTWTRNWLETVQQLTGRTPIIYTGPSFWETEMGNAQGFRRYPLWIAHYTTGQPRVPGGWTDWTFWQRTNTGRVAGISGAVDINRFNGTSARLATLAQAGPADGDTTTPAPGTGTTPDPGDDTTTPEPGTETPTEPGTETPTEPTPDTSDTKATTRVTLTLSDDSVFRGQTVTLAGALRDADGATMANRHVGVYRRREGATTWTKVAALTTDATGRYAFSLDAGRSASFRTTFRGSPKYAASASPRRSLTVRAKIGTRATLGVERIDLRRGTVKLYGHLRTVADRPLAGRTMHLFRRPSGSTAWTLVTRSTTLEPTGWYQALVRPRRTTTYKAVFRGGPAHARAVSNRTTVRVR
jgi:GH25 family lysozyme M1 (1,4-beta-N-acetylmuramidase)